MRIELEQKEKSGEKYSEKKKCGADFSAPHPVNTFYSVVSNKFKSLFSPVPPYRDRVYFRIQTTLDTILAV